MNGAGRYIALGDSYTIGEGVSPHERWPDRLAAALREAGRLVQPPEMVARSGWTCTDLEAGITAAGPAGRYDLVSLLIGVNDQFRGGTAAIYAPSFRRLLARAVALAGGRAGRVLVLSIPDWSVTPYATGRDRIAIATAIDAFNAVIHAEAGAVGAQCVDVTPDSRRAAADFSLLASDGLHPAGAMYASWARLALPAAARALRAG
jgi:lysophospholipase L1-like esterase